MEEYDDKWNIYYYKKFKRTPKKSIQKCSHDMHTASIMGKKMSNLKIVPASISSKIKRLISHLLGEKW